MAEQQSTTSYWIVYYGGKAFVFDSREEAIEATLNFGIQDTRAWATDTRVPNVLEDIHEGYVRLLEKISAGTKIKSIPTWFFSDNDVSMVRADTPPKKLAENTIKIAADLLEQREKLLEEKEETRKKLIEQAEELRLARLEEARLLAEATASKDYSKLDVKNMIEVLKTKGYVISKPV